MTGISQTTNKSSLKLVWGIFYPFILKIKLPCQRLLIFTNLLIIDNTPVYIADYKNSAS
jgi:hypothetical protein